MEEKVETLARTAVTALRDEELVEAQQVDFGSLDAGRRDAVAQSFIRAVAGQDTDDAGSEAPGGEVWAPDAELPEQGGAGISAPEQAAPAPLAGAQQASAESLPAASTPAVARAQPQPNAPQPVVTATFAPAVPAQPVGRSMTLEDSVREMLRPMLAEWLNQHMPRILEDAIRQEIKARGLPWDGGKTS
jgi:cell pole-organizing protein PopZ